MKIGLARSHVTLAGTNYKHAPSLGGGVSSKEDRNAPSEFSATSVYAVDI